MDRDYTTLPHEYLDELDCLTDAEFGRLVRALLEYSITGQEPELRGNEKAHWKRVRNREDRFRQSFAEKSEIRREAGKAGAAARWQKDGKNGKRILPLAKNDKRILPMASDGKEKEESTPLLPPFSLPPIPPISIPPYNPPAKEKKESEASLRSASCVEPEKTGSPPVVTLPLNDGSEFPVTNDDLREWAQLYPAVDVLQEVRKMRGWLLGNPKRRKTSKGISRFIQSWLAKEQDRGGSPGYGQAGPRQAKSYAEIAAEMEARGEL